MRVEWCIDINQVVCFEKHKITDIIVPLTGTIDAMNLSLKYIRKLAIFSEVVNSQSFTVASSQLGLSKSKVSEAISSLEQELGVKLLQRTTRKLALTHEGRAVYNYSAALLVNAKKAINIAQDTSQQVQGVLRVSCLDNVADLLLGSVLRRYRREYPDVQLEIFSGFKPVDIIEKEIDVAVRIGPLKDSSFIGAPLMDINASIYGSFEFLSGMPKAANIEALAGISLGVDGRLDTEQINGVCNGRWGDEEC